MKKYSCVKWILSAAVWGTALTVDAEAVKVSHFGFDAADSTAILQKAIDSGAKKVIIDKQKSPWISGPLMLRSDLELYLEDDTELAALPGSFPGLRDSMLTAVGARNILIHGGRNARITMRKKDYQDPKRYQPGEWRHTVNLLGAENVTVRDIRLSSSGGDGIYLGSLPQRKDVPCRNIVVDNVILDDHHRQGISVISVIDFKLLNSELRDTSGAAPQAGIDFEPNNPANHLQNILIENCRFVNNAGGGILVCPPCKEPVSITIRSCTVEGGIRGFGMNRLKNVPVSGNVLVENCMFRNVKGDVFIFRDHPDHIFNTTFRSCTISHPKAQPYAAPVSFMVEKDWSSRIGNIRFDDLRITGYEKSSPLDFKSLKSKAYLTKLEGSIDWNGKKCSPMELAAAKGWDKARPAKIRSISLVELTAPAGKAPQKVSPKLRNTVWLYLAPVNGELNFSLDVKKVRNKIVMDLLCPNGEAREFSDITQKGVHNFNIKAKQPGVYLLMLKAGKGMIQFQPGKDQHWAAGSAGEEFLDISLAKGRKFFFEVPAGVKEFTVEVAGDANEPVSAEVVSPGGKVAAAAKEIIAPKLLKVVRGNAEREIWQIRFPLMVEDSHLRLHAPLCSVFGDSPENVFSAGKP